MTTWQIARVYGNDDVMTTWWRPWWRRRRRRRQRGEALESRDIAIYCLQGWALRVVQWPISQTQWPTKLAISRARQYTLYCMLEMNAILYDRYERFFISIPFIFFYLIVCPRGEIIYLEETNLVTDMDLFPARLNLFYVWNCISAFLHKSRPLDILCAYRNVRVRWSRAVNILRAPGILWHKIWNIL